MKLTDEQGKARYPFLIIDSISFADRSSVPKTAAGATNTSERGR